ncbi:MAG: hypothetical protein NTY48_02175 [Candidatus Diapherotrites archaeon]|nr:hypothetical protein [Candidatus Diapherotrites archaeon]
MLNEQVINDTVSRLLDAGIDDATIISTLADAGVSREQAAQYLSQIKSQNGVPSQPNPSASQTEDIQRIKTQVDVQAEQHDLHQTMTNSLLDDHSEKIEDVINQVNEVRNTISSAPQAGDASLSMRIATVEQKVEEVNAGVKASLDLLQKILDNNRKILTELEAKK